MVSWSVIGVSMTGHRWRFDSLKEYVGWYNNRLHGAHLVWYGTPEEAFVRKMRPESMVGLMFK